MTSSTTGHNDDKSDPAPQVSDEIRRLLVEILQRQSVDTARQTKSDSLSLGLQVGNTAAFVRAGDHRTLSASISAALLGDMITHASLVAVGLGLVPELLNRIRRLRPDEIEVLAAMKEEYGSSNIYSTWMDEERLLGLLGGEMSEDDKRRLLARMKSRGILEEGAGEWKAVW